MILYEKATGKLLGICDGKVPETDTQGVVSDNIPPEIEPWSLILYKVVDGKVEMKIGAELIAAKNAMWPVIREILFDEYFGSAARNPATTGRFEGAVDILFQYVDKLIHGDKINPRDLEVWEDAFRVLSPHFRVTIADIPLEIDDLAFAKKSAREAYVKMKLDPRWPK